MTMIILRYLPNIINMGGKLLRKEAENMSLTWELSKILKRENGSLSIYLQFVKIYEKTKYN